MIGGFFSGTAFIPKQKWYLMFKTALIIDVKPDAGGGIGMCLSKLNYFRKIKKENFLVVSTYKSTSLFLKKKYKI